MCFLPYISKVNYKQNQEKCERERNCQEQYPKLKNPNLKKKIKIDYILQNPKNNNNKTKNTNKANQIKMTKNIIENMRDESMEETNDY